MKKRRSLRRTWDRIRTVPGLGRNVTALAVILALGITSLSIILGSQGFIAPWKEQYEFSIDFTETPGVDATQHPKVRIAGVVVGQVTDATLGPDGAGRLLVSIDPEHKIYTNARAVLRPTNPVNEMYVEINPGGPPAEPLPPEGVIPATQTERPVQSDEVLNHLDTRTRTALTNLLSMSDVALANAPQQLPAGLKATDATVAQFKPVVDALLTRRQNIADLITAIADLTKAVGGNDQRLASLATSTQRTLQVLAQNSDSLTQSLRQLPGTTDQLRNAMSGVHDLTGELNPALDNLNRASDQLPSALDRVSGLVDDLGGTVRSAAPVVAAAGPVVSDLRPLVHDVNRALGDVVPVTRNLGPVTEVLVPYLGDLQAFIFNSSSIFSVSDANGGMVRGHLVVPLPDAGVVPGAHRGNQFPQQGGK